MSLLASPSTLSHLPSLHSLGSTLTTALSNGAARFAVLSRLSLPSSFQQARNGGSQFSKRYSASATLHTSNQAPVVASLATSARQTLRRRLVSAAASRTGSRWTNFTQTRNFSTSRRVMSDLTEHDLAHIAAQRRT